MEYERMNEARIIDFIYKHRIACIVVALVMFVGIGIIITLVVMREQYNDEPGSVIVTTDSVSGVTLLDINEEPEGGVRPALLGFEVLINAGFTYAQYDLIADGIRAYFQENVENSKSVSYKDDSFRQTKGLDGTFNSTLIMVEDANKKEYSMTILIGTDNNDMQIIIESR